VAELVVAMAAHHAPKVEVVDFSTSGESNRPIVGRSQQPGT